MNKIFLVLAIIAFPTFLFAAGASEGEQNNYQGSPHVLIPYGVTVIDRNSGLQNRELLSVKIPSSVIVIDQYAFQENRLTNVTIPDSVTVIGYGAFQNNRLTSVFIGNSVLSIDYYAFGNNNDLRSITISANVKLNYSFPNNFDSAYTNNNSRAGTYTYDGSRWNYRGQ